MKRLFDRKIDIQVSRLRLQIEADPKHPEIIRTTHNGAYIIAATVRSHENPFPDTLAFRKSARVPLALSATSLHVLIEYEGPGIPEDRLEDVFNPFIRLEDSRNHGTGGAGLGLSVARTNIHPRPWRRYYPHKPRQGRAVHKHPAPA